MRLALFGGTFDPIHNAHLAIAQAAADRFQLDRVLFVPAAHPPHKRGATHAPYEDRVRMAELACAVDARFEVSRMEDHTARSYSIDTIEKVRARLATEDELYFLIGADAFAEIRTWHRWREVARAVRFLVVSRPGAHYEAPAEAACSVINEIDLPVSSSGIRRAIAAGERPTGIPEAVLQYAIEHKLYS
ncbi:MAG TPA: nicotinate-nucleotide adenylyltransferase [Candidatus Acidoferrales bacterium]|nr:nicotinate-nucleotide adenylyltransferase [Candidatus Acidoferrales bacterium]